MRKGIIALVPFPFTDLSGQKVRPALILHASQKGENCIVAFITSAQQRTAYPFDVPILSSKQNGLILNSVVKLNNLATLQKTIVLGELGVAEASLMREVDRMLKALFGL